MCESMYVIEWMVLPPASQGQYSHLAITCMFVCTQAYVYVYVCMWRAAYCMGVHAAVSIILIARIYMDAEPE